MTFQDLEPIPFWGKKKDKLAYLHKQPKIKPNYGKTEKSYLPKTNVARVLLYDNAMQDQMLDVQLRYIGRQKSRVFGMLDKNRFAFWEQQQIRQRWHNIWNHRYTEMKDSFIAQFGTEYMPIPTPEPEIDPFLINARIAPPINILCYYLDGTEPSKKAKDKSKKQTKLIDVNEPTTATYFYDSNRLMGEIEKKHSLYTNSVEDPRFRNLQQSLIPPRFHTDGYLQLSPGYLKETRKVKRKPPPKSKGGVVLPGFYVRQRITSRESMRSVGSHKSTVKQSESLLNVSENAADDSDGEEDDPSKDYGGALNAIGRQ